MQEKEVAKEEIVEEEERKERREETKREESKVKISEKEEKEAEVIPSKEKHIEVPIIKLEKISELEFKKLELDKNIPQIEKRKTVVSIPILKLQEPSLMLKELELDCKILSLEKRKKQLKIPIIKAASPPKVSIPITFDSEIRKPRPIVLPKPKVPLYKKGIPVSPKILLESFDSAISEELKKRLEEAKELKKDITKEVKPAEPTPPSSGGEGEEIPDFLEVAFGSAGGKIRGKGPKIILFKDREDDSYINFLENVCLRIYREMEGGEPKAVKILKLDEMNKREIEKWLEAGGKIFTINMENYDKLDETHLWERLEETYSERLGFIIFTAKSMNKFKSVGVLLQNINNKAQNRFNIIELEAKELPAKLIELASGMIKLEKPTLEKAYIEVEGKRVPIGDTFDSLFNIYLFKENSRFNTALEKIKEEEKGLFKESTKPSKEAESPLHFNIKVFLVKYLVNELRKKGEKLSTREEIMRKIKTEEELSEGVIPDVLIESNNQKEVYEVETLFGPHPEGEPDLKITKTVDKYDKVSGIAKVNIVMDNFGFLLHLKELLNKKEHFKNKPFKVEFYTLDLQNMKLISIDEFVKELEKIKIIKY
jgi:hypothetical protein